MDCKPKPGNSPAAQLRAEIRRAGPVSFARFMDLALYSPGCGYYQRPRPIGRRGDFFTSVSVGPLFGELLALQFSRWLAQITPPPPPAKLQIVEAGAHNGQLARDILGWLRVSRPELALDYCLVEPSPMRRSWQEKTLARHFPNVQWAADIGQLAPRRVTGVIFSNELLDAMPVHRLCWDAAGQTWLECRVNLRGEDFVWQTAPPPPALAPFLPEVPPEVALVLPDGFAVEVSPPALHWWTRAAECLQCGWLLTLDYGFDADEWLRPERAGGTLRAYQRHRLSGNVLAQPGQQDITAHVNFSAVRQAGERAGLRTEFLVRQSNFLTEIFQRSREVGSGLEEWTPSRVRQFQTLTHPEHLGHRFRALLQSRGASCSHHQAICQFPRPAQRGEGQGEGFVPSNGGNAKMRPQSR
ncbi:MAG: SAM-dependent methyltransferase [Verrucomicrobiota bacterium]|jgi:SAM-dependent MidA family methyltransferase